MDGWKGWLAIAFSVAIGVTLIVMGVLGVKNKRIRTRIGPVHGWFAQVLGVAYVALGLVAAIVLPQGVGLNYMN